MEAPCSRDRFARSLALGSMTFLLAAVRPAAAQGSDRALAEQLFRIGQQLMQAARYAEACPKLAESQRLDPGMGTLLNLALCHEHQGKLASAWTEYNDVLTLARRDQRPDRVQYAEQRLSGLEPKLARLTVQLEPGNAVSGLVVRLDGETLGGPAFGVATPVDPGPHTVSASAPGFRSWETQVEISSTPEQKQVQVPKLEVDPTARASAAQGPSAGTSDGHPTPGDTTGRRGNTQRITAFTLGGVGVVGLALGSFFGLKAISKNNESNDQGCAGNQCPPDAAETRRSAISAGHVSTAAFIVGGVALAGGVVLYLTAPRSRGEKPPSARAVVRLSPGVASLRVGAAW